MHQKQVLLDPNNTMNGWQRDSPDKTHSRHSSLFQKLRQNLAKCQSKSRQSCRLPLIPSNRNGNSLQSQKLLIEPHQKRSMKNQQNSKVSKVIPLRLKTLIFHQFNENHFIDSQIPHKEDQKSKMKSKEKTRRKFGVKNNVKQDTIQNCQLFADDAMFFKDSFHGKSHSVKLYFRAL